MGLSIDQTQPRKESGSWKICQEKLPKLKRKEKKNIRNRTEHHGTHNGKSPGEGAESKKPDQRRGHTS